MSSVITGDEAWRPWVGEVDLPRSLVPPQAKFLEELGWILDTYRPRFLDRVGSSITMPTAAQDSLGRRLVRDPLRVLLVHAVEPEITIIVDVGRFEGSLRLLGAETLETAHDDPRYVRPWYSRLATRVGELLRGQITIHQVFGEHDRLMSSRFSDVPNPGTKGITGSIERMTGALPIIGRERHTVVFEVDFGTTEPHER